MRKRTDGQLAIGALIAFAVWIFVALPLYYGPRDNFPASKCSAKEIEQYSFWEKARCDPIAYFTIWLVGFTARFSRFDHRPLGRNVAERRKTVQGHGSAGIGKSPDRRGSGQGICRRYADQTGTAYASIRRSRRNNVDSNFCEEYRPVASPKLSLASDYPIHRIAASRCRLRTDAWRELARNERRWHSSRSRAMRMERCWGERRCATNSPPFRPSSGFGLILSSKTFSESITRAKRILPGFSRERLWDLIKPTSDQLNGRECSDVRTRSAIGFPSPRRSAPSATSPRL